MKLLWIEDVYQPDEELTVEELCRFSRCRIDRVKLDSWKQMEIVWKILIRVMKDDPTLFKGENSFAYIPQHPSGWMEN